MNDIRRSVPVTVQHVVSLTNAEVDRIVENRLREMADGITIKDNVVCYKNIMFTALKDDSFLTQTRKILDNAGPVEYEVCISLLAHQLYSALLQAKMARPPV